MATRFPQIQQTVHPAAELCVRQSFDHLIPVGKRGQEPGELWMPTSVAVDPRSDRIYVTDGVNHSARVSIFSEKGEFMDMFTHEQLKSPWGIAVINDNVCLTDTRKHCVFQFKLTPEIRLAAMIGDRGSGIGQFNVPKQLTISDKGDIFVADFNNNRIQVLNCNLKYQRHISHHSMTQPCDVKLAADELYILSSADSPCLHVFSHAGDRLRSLITCGDEMQVACPYFFLHAEGNFLLSDNAANKIKIFSEEGALLHTLGEYRGEVGKFYSPYGISFTRSLKLIVLSWNEKYGLQIFS